MNVEAAAGIAVSEVPDLSYRLVPAMDLPRGRDQHTKSTHYDSLIWAMTEDHKVIFKGKIPQARKSFMATLELIDELAKEGLTDLHPALMVDVYIPNDFFDRLT